MKLIYSELKKFLPDLIVKSQQLRDDLTMIGHFTNYYEELDDEIVFDLDIKVNRGDCLGYLGLAKDLSVFYKIPLILPTPYQIPNIKYQIPISVTAKNEVSRIMAVKISNLSNSSSPKWLKNFLKLHQINSINTVVDLTNYIMFFYGIPNHAFDTAKSTDNLVWESNTKFTEFTTLDGTNLKLKPGILMVNNPDSPLSLSFLGGETCAIELNTKDIIIEMAVYDRTRVRQDSRSLKIVTEAGIRLEKDLDPDTIPLAFNHLVSLIQTTCGGTISSTLFDYYPHPASAKPILFDPQKPSRYAGITIPSEFSLDALTRLGCTISHNLITPPTIRKDITQEEDLIEEVIRFYGYNKIPTGTPISNKSLPDITPKIIYLIEQLKDKLAALGYDEVRSWPLVGHCHKPCREAIYTQNSINSEFPVLRQSIIQSLELQLDQYYRYKLPSPQFFEIGKIFYQQNGQYFEKFALGLYHHSTSQLQADLKSLNLPCNLSGNFSEIILDDLSLPDFYQPQVISNSAFELTSQIITLDANIMLPSAVDPIALIKKYSLIIGPDHLWQLTITDIYHDSKSNNFRYTFRASYFNIDDKTAKKIHLKAFGLN